MMRTSLCLSVALFSMVSCVSSGRTRDEPKLTSSGSVKLLKSDGRKLMDVYVIDVRPNGSVVIFGETTLGENSEADTLTLTGLVSPEAMMTGRIRARDVANLDVRLFSRGCMSEAQGRRQGWWLLEELWPF